jgi:hypothetical protein
LIARARHDADQEGALDIDKRQKLFELRALRQREE